MINRLAQGAHGKVDAARKGGASDSSTGGQDPGDS